VKKKVPLLGDENSTFEEINDFYAFWYDFDSWREFSYLDEENKDSAQDRDERRWIDKQNKAARAKRKKEETARIRQLVDNAYACDPRIIKFKQEEKKKKEDEKAKRKEAARQREEEHARVSCLCLIRFRVKKPRNPEFSLNSRNKRKLV
jgi:DnaJ family protein C protein 2